MASVARLYWLGPGRTFHRGKERRMRTSADGFGIPLIER